MGSTVSIISKILDLRPKSAATNDNSTPKIKSVPIWKSRLSRRVAFAVFLTILAVQTTIMFLTIQQEEEKLLGNIKEIGRSSIASSLDQSVDYLEMPLGKEKTNRLMSSTLVNGIAVYSSELLFLGAEGEPVSLVMINEDNLSKTYRTIDGSSYDVVYRPNDLRRPYIVVARLNTSSVNTALQQHITNTIIVMLLLSAFVTTVLMITLGHWLLEPIMFMRNNLLAAQENPENPKISAVPFKSNDEVGDAVRISQKLILKNSENMRQIRSAAEDKIHKLAYFDQLTGLPNRTYFIQKLMETAYADNASEAKKLAVVTLDLDHFKDINDSMGHSVGDAILRAIGKRLKLSLPESAVVARAGEDEFAVTMPLTNELTKSRDVAEKVAGIIRSEPFKAYNESFQIRTSVGVATYPDDGADPSDTLKNADIALNRAKEEGRDRIYEYSEDFDKAVQQRFQLLRDLRDALENDDLTVFYQAQFDLKTGAMIGAEALIRWWKKDNSKEGGHFISPVDFIPIAEQSGLIVPIGEWVMRHACQTAKTWHDAGTKIRIAVNVSGAQFFQSDLVQSTTKILEETGLEAQYLELEVTESVFMDDISIAVNTMQKLHKLGVELAIDDFGTGYSSLAYLRQFNVDRLKIDQSFTRNALNNADDAAIARTIISLAHSLNLRVIAEGVETKDHENFLIEEGCDEVQGFRYSKPIPEDDFMTFSKAYKNDLSVFDAS